jgi:hypothetical protein
MRARVLISFVVVLLASVALVSASGAATTKAQKVTRIDVSTRLAVVHYLRSIHVNPKGAVIERGVRNYAGAHCPGKGWTCASTKHTVVQIARHGGKNRFRCSSSHCVVVQISGVARGVYVPGRQLASTGAKGGGGSTATCIKTGSGATTGTGQTCTISQSGSGPNTAGVYENTQKVSGLTQTAQYTALITQQSSGSNLNRACVTQIINLDGSTSNTNGKPTTANLQAHQSITIRQDNSGNGTNSAQYAATSTGACDTSSTSTLTQSQTLSSTITATGPITQNEDTSYAPCGDGVTGDYANLCLDIEQNQSAGFKCTSSTSCPSSTTNTAIFTQNSTQNEVANATKGASGTAVNQTQTNPVCDPTNPNIPANCVFPGGLVGTVNQDSSGVSTATPTQTETQCEDAATSGLSATNCSPTPTPPDSPNIPNLTQKQYGPVGVGSVRHNHRGRVLFSHGKGLGHAKQTGNAGDSYTITQTSTQNADKGAFQQNFGQADCNTAGFCTATQTTTVNGGTPVQDGYTASAIGNLVINCPTGTTCQGTAPPAPTSVTGPPTNPYFSSSAPFTITDSATGGVTFLCKIDGGPPNGVIDNCSSDTPFFQGYGAHTIQVAATDAFGNVSAYVPANPISWTNVPPAPVIDSGPANGSTTESKSPKFTFHDSDTSLSFVCSQDGTTYTACSPGGTGSGEQDYAGPLALGTQNFYVEATDGHSHFSSPVSRQWTILPTCDAGTGNALAAYNPLPLDVTHCGPASEGFEANADNEFGDLVTLDTTGGTSLQSLTVDLQSYGCGDSGNWYTGTTDPCTTTPGKTFTVPGGITATIYSVTPDGGVGSVIASSTINPQIPYRPSADPTNCPGGVSGVEAGGQWYDPLAQKCRYSVSDLVTFNNWTFANGTPTFSNGDQVIWTVQFDTTDAGYAPIGTKACNSLDQGCGYDSLNVGATSFNNAPYAGADPSEDTAFRSYDTTYGGTVVPLGRDPNWTGFRPLGEIVLGAPPPPPQ